MIKSRHCEERKQSARALQRFNKQLIQNYVGISNSAALVASSDQRARSLRDRKYIAMNERNSLLFVVDGQKTQRILGEPIPI